MTELPSTNPSANGALACGLVTALSNATATSTADGLEGLTLGHAVAADAEFAELAAVVAVVGHAEAVDAFEAALNAGSITDPTTAVGGTAGAAGTIWRTAGTAIADFIAWAALASAGNGVVGTAEVVGGSGVLVIEAGLAVVAACSRVFTGTRA